MAFASPKEQEWNQIPSRSKGPLFHKKNRAGIDSLYFALKEKRSKKGKEMR